MSKINSSSAVKPFLDKLLRVSLGTKMMAKSLNRRTQGQGATIWIGVRTRVRFRVPPPYSKARTRFGLFHVCPLRQFWRPFADLPCERHCSKTRIFPLYGPLCFLFYLFASRACARSVTILMRVSVRSVVVGKWLPPATEVRPTSQSGGRCLRHARPRQQRTLRGDHRSRQPGTGRRHLHGISWLPRGQGTVAGQ